MSKFNINKLNELLILITHGWSTQQSESTGKSKSLYDTTLDDYTNIKNKPYNPTFKKGNATWDCHFTLNCGNKWQKGKISIPKWLFFNFINGKSDFVSPSLINLKKI